MENFERKVFGWIKHSEAYAEREIKKIPTIGHHNIAPYVNVKPVKDLPPVNIEALQYNIPIEDQGQYGTCSAEMATGLIKYFDKIHDGNFKEPSVLYNYYFSRLINGGHAPIDDTGSTVLAALTAAIKYGVALDNDWPYTEPLNQEPSQEARDDAKNYEVLRAAAIPDLEDDNLDPAKNTKILTMKQLIDAKYYIGFGSVVKKSIYTVGKGGLEPYSKPGDLKDPEVGGHARRAVGYKDDIQIPGAPVKGAFLVANSWSPNWGWNGFSWVSYQVFIDQETNGMFLVNTKYKN